MQTILPKIYSFLRDPRMPWIVEHYVELLRMIYKYYQKLIVTKLHRINNKTPPNKTTVQFNCAFHGKTGGVVAIANIANMLAKAYHVEFVAKPKSFYNLLLDSNIDYLKETNFDADIYICDVSCEHRFLSALRSANKKLVVTCHGLPAQLHGLHPEYVENSLRLANFVHFVNIMQQKAFNFSQKESVVIPNITKRINKTHCNNNVGTVGNLSLPQKNVEEAIEIALRSNADCIHLWGGGSNCGNRRIKVHPWENNKEKIYNSFDVLLVMSKLETFSMTVMEALSAGIPCMISAIPAHEQYRACPGVVIIDEFIRKDAPELLNNLLQQKNVLKPQIIDFWESNYDEDIVLKKWKKLLSFH
jgi:glycosyltransferase involved in cell wall biosynthesis